MPTHRKVLTVEVTARDGIDTSEVSPHLGLDPVRRYAGGMSKRRSRLTCQSWNRCDDCGSIDWFVERAAHSLR